MSARIRGQVLRACDQCGSEFRGYRSSRLCGADACRKADRRDHYQADPVFRERARRYARERLRRHWTTPFTEDDYLTALERQAGRCAICGDPPGKGRLAPDHDHATGRFRALLCIRCNTGLGKFRDDAGRLTAAIAYLDRHTSASPDQDKSRKSNGILPTGPSV